MAQRRKISEGNGAAAHDSNVQARLARLEQLEERFAEELERAKRAALKEFAYGAGHELNNPLANIATRAQTLLKEETHPEKRRRLAAINAQAFRAHDMIADLMLYARPPKLERKRFDVATWLTQATAALVQLAVEQKTDLRITPLAAPIELDADAVQLSVALRAVVINSLEALQQGGIVQIAVTAAADASSPNEVRIAVTDNGPGIPLDTRDHIFDPFFSGREAGRGLGFGLCKAWSIVHEHGGRIDVDIVVGQGTTMTFVLSRERAATESN